MWNLYCSGEHPQPFKVNENDGEFPYDRQFKKEEGQRKQNESAEYGELYLVVQMMHWDV